MPELGISEIFDFLRASQKICFHLGFSNSRKAVAFLSVCANICLSASLSWKATWLVVICVHAHVGFGLK